MLSVNAWGLVQDYRYRSFNIPVSRDEICHWIEDLPFWTVAAMMHAMDSETMPYKHLKLAVKESSDRRFLVYYAWEQDPMWFRMNATLEEMFADEAPVEPRRRLLVGVSTPCSCPRSRRSSNSLLTVPQSDSF